jgi:hypothetical protein
MLPSKVNSINPHYWIAENLNQSKKEMIIMARIGKIARLSSAVRAQLNKSRLQDGAEGRQIVKLID